MKEGENLHQNTSKKDETPPTKNTKASACTHARTHVIATLKVIGLFKLQLRM